MKKTIEHPGKYPVFIFYTVFGLVIFSLWGFNKSYFQFFPQFINVDWAIHFHVITIFCWFVMLVTQAILAKNGKLKLHSSIGKISYFLVPVILVGIILATNFGQLRQKNPELLGATFFDGTMFLLFYILAIANKKNRTSHAQYMMLSAIPFMNPALGRAVHFGFSLALEFLIFSMLFLFAYFRKTPYRPFLIAIGIYLLLLLIVMYVSFGNPDIIGSLWNAIWG